jgi:predicted RND superfamily exporter protein
MKNMMSMKTENSAGEEVSPISGYLNNGYALYTIGVTTPVEGEDTFVSLDNVEKLIIDLFGEDCGYQIVGMSQAAKDFSEITPTDFTRVSIASMIIIFVILFFTFRSVKYSVLLLLVIQFGIWINLALQNVIGTQINFMSYIIISSVQLGATVDYAILITAKYRENRFKLMPSAAAYYATTSSVMSVLTSASIMAGACLSVFFISSNLIVSEMTMLIARGSIISALLVLFVLPAVLAYMDRPLPNIKTWSIEQNNALRKQLGLKKGNENKQKIKDKKELTSHQKKILAQKQKAEEDLKKFFRIDDYRKGDDEEDTLE